MDKKPIGIYIIEDDITILESLKCIIEEEGDFYYCGSATSAEQGIEALKHIQLDVLLLDITLPKMNGLEAIPIIKEIQPDLNILILTVHDDNETVFTALRYGAVGYLLKGYSMEAIFSGIKEVVKGGAPISPSIARSIINTFRVEETPVLSKREMEVLQKLSNGSNNPQIAKELYVTTNTIKAHVKNIYKKLHVHSRVEAVRKAIRQGIIK